MLAGSLTDRAVARGASEARLRRMVMVVGSLAAAAGIASIVGAEGERAVIVRLVVTGFFVGVYHSGLLLISQIFAGPRAAGSWVGTQNAVGNMAGILGPVITGALIDWTAGYTTPFLVTACVVAAGALGWSLAVPRIQPCDWSAAAAPAGGSV